VNEEAMAHWGLSRQKQTNKQYTMNLNLRHQRIISSVKSTAGPK